MNDAEKELVAIGASVASHCMPCLEYHIEQALALDVPDEEIDEAIAVGQMVSRGATKKYGEFIRAIRVNKETLDDERVNCCKGAS